jgi:signal transduction histidine kinase
MSKKRNKPYIPKKRHNNEYIAHQVDDLVKDVEQHRRVLEIVTASYNKHVEHLSNFAMHDMKNAIQSLDSIVTTTEPEEFNEEIVLSLKTHLKTLRATLDNFKKLVPYTKEGDFKLNNLFTAVELLARCELLENKILLEIEYDRNSEAEFSLPFQAVLQMFHNVIINSITALKDSSLKKITISIVIFENECIVSIKDSGNEIDESIIDKIFDYKFSTTGGSGIGLFHAKYVCDKIKGDISVKAIKGNEYTKEFVIKLPLKQI